MPLTNRTDTPKPVPRAQRPLKPTPCACRPRTAPGWGKETRPGPQREQCLGSFCLENPAGSVGKLLQQQENLVRGSCDLNIQK